MVIKMRKILGLSKLNGSYSPKATIAKEAADILQVKEGDRILFVEEDGRIYIEKAV